VQRHIDAGEESGSGVKNCLIANENVDGLASCLLVDDEADQHRQVGDEGEDTRDD